MSYLVVYVENEKFTPKIISSNLTETEDWYTLKTDDPETVRLASYLDPTCDIPVDHFKDNLVELVVDRRVEKRFFRTKTTITYTFRVNRFSQEFESDLVYLEE